MGHSQASEMTGKMVPFFGVFLPCKNELKEFDNQGKRDMFIRLHNKKCIMCANLKKFTSIVTTKNNQNHHNFMNELHK